MSTAPKNPKDPEPAAEPKPAAAPAPAEEKPAKKEKPAKGKEGKGKAPKGEGAPGTAKKTKKIPDNPDFRYIVRLANTDLDGTRATALALTGVRGVGLRMAEVVCRSAGVNGAEMIGNLPETTVEGIEQVLSQLPEKLPPWMLNHPRDYALGEVHHFVGGDLETARRDDVNLMKMVRSYRGVRHERGQKVRGQRTRSNGRTGMAAGVLKKAAKEAAAAKSSEEKPAAAAPAAAPAAPAAAPAAKKEK
ncbi:MAG TPA: 30S ribosomal protein S13 [Thermoplasmata archaeon]|nr:30S ribosomal protein S13 [Thermoplasmata archaeon]